MFRAEHFGGLVGMFRPPGQTVLSVPRLRGGAKDASASSHPRRTKNTPEKQAEPGEIGKE